jgi:hypothetical protein
VSYIVGDVPIIALSHFVHTHILCEELGHSISMLYEGASKVLWLPNPTLVLHSCEQLLGTSSIIWEMLTTATQVHRALLGMPIWRRHDRLPLSPSGTLGTVAAFWSIREVVVCTIVTIFSGPVVE